MWEEIVTETVTLVAVIDPIGSVALFLSLTKNQSAAQRRAIATKSVVIATLVLMGFIVIGQILLEAMGVKIASFQVAGGIVLLIFGLTMIFDIDMSSGNGTAEADADIAVFPMAMPSIASPGAMMAVVVLTDNDRNNLTQQTVTASLLLLVMALTWGMLMLASYIQRLIGNTGCNILKRVMGLILASIAVETGLQGAADFFRANGS